MRSQQEGQNLRAKTKKDPMEDRTQIALHQAQDISGGIGLTVQKYISEQGISRHKQSVEKEDLQKNLINSKDANRILLLYKAVLEIIRHISFLKIRLERNFKTTHVNQFLLFFSFFFPEVYLLFLNFIFTLFYFIILYWFCHTLP